MAITPTPAYPQNPKVTQITIANADASNQKVVCTAGTNGSKVTALQLCSDDTSDRLIQVLVNRSGTSILLETVNVPTLSGTDGAASAVNALADLPAIDNDGQNYLLLESGDTLEIKSTTTVTAAKTVSATCVFSNF